MNFPVLPDKFTRCFHNDRKNLAHFAKPAAGEKPDEIRLARFAGASRREIFDHRMTDENRAQPRLIVELRFERKDAEHQVEITRHLPDAPAVPSPDLRADVINYFEIGRTSPQRASEPEIETWVIDQDDGSGIQVRNFPKRVSKLFPEISVALHDFPKSNDRRGVDPIDELFARNFFHARPAASDKLEIGPQHAQRLQQLRAVLVPARFARDEIKA